jgi:antitoxin MazE
MNSKVAHLTVQKWGNSLAVRIPASIARTAHFQIGTVVDLTVFEDGVFLRSAGVRKLTLEQRLELFDPNKHGGEMMPFDPIGLEEF